MLKAIYRTMTKKQYLPPHCVICTIQQTGIIASSAPDIRVYDEYEENLTPLVKENTANPIQWDGWDEEW